MPTNDGLLVFADISGYTKFVTETEIDHSWAILHELLDCMVRSVEGRLRMSQVEGDCVLFVGGLSDDDVIDLLEQSFVGFRRRLRAMEEHTTCPCNACRSIGVLSLKYIVHRGEYSVQRLGGVEQLHGADVIVGFRLLKNHVPSREYLLVTRPVLERLSGERAARFTPHVESYESVGEIAAAYETLAQFWEAAMARERRRVGPEDALFTIAGDLDVPLDVAWEFLTDAEQLRRCLGVPKVNLVGGARGSLVDGEFHCHHGRDLKEVTTMRVLAAEQPHELSLRCRGGNMEFDQTSTLEPLAGGRSRLTIRCTFDQEPGLRGFAMRVVFLLAMRHYMGSFTRRARRLSREVAGSMAASTT